MKQTLRLLGGLAAGLLLAACATTAPDSGAEAASTCREAVGRYADAGQAGTGRSQPLSQVLALDPEPFAAVPVAERAIEVRPGEGAFYVIAIAKTTPPDTVDLWEFGARCIDGELRFETGSRYESDEGGRVTRQQMRFALLQDADGALVVRRQSRQRALGFLSLRRGGDPVDYFRFPPFR